MEFSWSESGVLLIQLAMGVSLAACAGMRAFLPLLVVGVAGRLEIIPLAGPFEWLAGWPTLIVFGVAVITELLGDKLPAVDNMLDVLQTFVKPVAGTILVASVITELSPLQSVVLGIILGGGAAGIVHLLKAKLRIFSTAATAGTANPVISTVEDAGTLAASVGAIFVPFLILAMILAAVTAGWIALKKLARIARKGTG